MSTTLKTLTTPAISLCAVALAACSVDGAGQPALEGGAGGKADGAGEPSLRHCTGGSLPDDLPTVAWNRWQSSIIAAAAPGHSANDVLATRIDHAVVSGKFAYGPTSKDLEGERVEVWIDDCDGGAARVGEAVTDGDGRIDVALDGDDLPGVGIYDVAMRVMGDGTTVRSQLRVFPAGTRIMVFDIDGTLTTHDWEGVKDVLAELFEPLGAGDYVPKARDAAVEITRLRQSQGYPVVYLTGRPYWITTLSREWLEDLGFAPGTVMLAPSIEDALPMDDHVGDYKANLLIELAEAGFEIEAAYGNASTDIYAYDVAAVPTERTFITGPHGGEHDTVDLGDGYVEHLDDAAAEPLPDQPFHW